MERITISKSCKKCERSSTYVKKKIHNEYFYVCSHCGFKLCPENKIMDHAFPTESKPFTSKARQYGFSKKDNKKYRKESRWN